MRVSEAFPSKYLKCSDLNGRPVRVVIDQITSEEIGSNKDRRPVVYFQGKEKGLVLNKTNANVIAEMFGDEMAGWSNKQIVLRPTKTPFEGKMVDAIRVEFVQPPPRTTTGTRAAKPIATNDPLPHDEVPDHADMDDEIPF